MRLRELIQSNSNSFLPESGEEYAENVTVDWDKLLATLTIIATDPDLKGVKPVDAIMFLGLIGDPNAGEWDVQMKNPAKFGVVNNKGMKDIKAMKGIQGFYNSPGSFYKGPNDKPLTFTGFDILINPEYWKEIKADNDTPELIAHEARHRGFEIIFKNKWTLARIPKELQDYRWIQDWPMKHNDREYWDSWEHYCLWSLERRGRTSFGKGYIFADKAEMLKFRRWYYQLEAIAKEYVATIKVPPGGYEALRREIDKKTPANIDITVKPSPTGGKPIIIGTLSAEEIERRNKDIQGGADIDNSGKPVGQQSAQPPAITPPATPRRWQDQERPK